MICVLRWSIASTTQRTRSDETSQLILENLATSETVWQGLLLRFLAPVHRRRPKKPAGTSTKVLALPSIVHRRGGSMAGGPPDWESGVISTANTARRGWHDQGVAAGVMVTGKSMSRVVRWIPRLDAQCRLGDAVSASLPHVGGCFVGPDGSGGPNRGHGPRLQAATRALILVGAVRGSAYAENMRITVPGQHAARGTAGRDIVHRCAASCLFCVQSVLAGIRHRDAGRRWHAVEGVLSDRCRVGPHCREDDLRRQLMLKL